jgi:alpha,alpha-trehalase
MIRVYVEHTNDTSIIGRALPTLEKEHQFFMNNRTVDVEVDGETYTLNHYAVSNTQPRPESYYEDYVTANNESYYAEGGIIYPGKELGKDYSHGLAIEYAS